VIQRWLNARVQGRAINAGLKREHSHTGSYSAIVRIVRRRGERPPKVTVRLDWAPNDARHAQERPLPGHFRAW